MLEERNENPVKVKKSKAPLIIILSIVVVLIAGSVVAYQMYQKHLEEVARQEYLAYIELRDTTINEENFYDGIVINGMQMGGKTKDAVLAEMKKFEDTLKADIKITVKYNDTKYEYGLSDFEYLFDTKKIVDEAYAYARSGDPDERYNQVIALPTENKSFEITSTFKYSNLDTYIKKIAEDIYTDPINATVKSFNPSASGDSMFVFTEARKGIEVDTKKLKEDMEKLLLSETKRGEITVPTHDIDYSVSSSDLKARTGLLSHYTTVSTNTADGNHNMALGLNRLNGSVLLSGETLSFNGKTGNSNLASNGYREAGAIKDGKLIKEFGGGICQASTTLYGAALRADLEIVERYNHSWPSSYVPIGQDAAINYPSADLKVRNNSAYPVYIKAYMSGTTLNVMIYGAGSSSWDKINVVSWKTEEIKPAETKKVDDPTLAIGQTVVDKESRVGYRSSGEKVYYKNGAEVKRVAIRSSYYPAIQGVTKVGTKVVEKPTTSTTSKPSTSTSSKPATSTSSKPSTSTSSKPTTSTSSKPATDTSSKPTNSENTSSSNTTTED